MTTESNRAVWQTILTYHENLDRQLTTKANFLLAIATVLLAVTLNKILLPEFNNLDTLTRTAITVLALGGGFALTTSLIIILPKAKIKHETHKEDLFNYRNVMQFSREEFLKYLQKLPQNEENIGRAYAHQIYTLSKKIIPYKLLALKIGGWSIILALLASSIFLAINAISLI